MHCREILFTLRNALYKFKTYLLTYLLTPRCSPRARAFPRLVNFFLWRTVAELRGIKSAQFSDFGLFSPYKTSKTYLPVTSLHPLQGLHRRMILIFQCGSRTSKGMLSGSGVFLRLLVEELGTPKLAQIFAYGKMAISIQNATARRVRSGPKMSENAQF